MDQNKVPAVCCQQSSQTAAFLSPLQHYTFSHHTECESPPPPSCRTHSNVLFLITASHLTTRCACFKWVLKSKNCGLFIVLTCWKIFMWVCFSVCLYLLFLRDGPVSGRHSYQCHLCHISCSRRRRSGWARRRRRSKSNRAPLWRWWWSNPGRSPADPRSSWWISPPTTQCFGQTTGM